jgi:hypothetical protein
VFQVGQLLHQVAQLLLVVVVIALLVGVIKLQPLTQDLHTMPQVVQVAAVVEEIILQQVVIAVQVQ